MRLADKAYRTGIKHFIYASSGSVYGLKDEDQVTEDLELFPLSEYNKTKMVAERVLLSYKKNMTMQIVRPCDCLWFVSEDATGRFCEFTHNAGTGKRSDNGSRRRSNETKYSYR